VLCRIAAASHEDLQATLLLLNNSTAIDRSTSVICLSTVVPRRVMPLLGQAGDRPASRAPHSAAAPHRAAHSGLVSQNDQMTLIALEEHLIPADLIDQCGPGGRLRTPCATP